MSMNKNQGRWHQEYRDIDDRNMQLKHERDVMDRHDQSCGGKPIVVEHPDGHMSEVKAWARERTPLYVDVTYRDRELEVTTNSRFRFAVIDGPTGMVQSLHLHREDAFAAQKKTKRLFYAAITQGDNT